MADHYRTRINQAEGGFPAGRVDHRETRPALPTRMDATRRADLQVLPR